MKNFLGVLVIAIPFSGLLSGQQGRGTFTGIVTDSTRFRLCTMKTRHLPLLALLLCALFPVERVLADDKQPSRSIGTSVQNGWVTVTPPEFHGAINNPLKGFRDYKKDGYGLL